MDKEVAGKLWNVSEGGRCTQRKVLKKTEEESRLVGGQVEPNGDNRGHVL